MTILPGLVKDDFPPAGDTEVSPITIPPGTILITTKQHNQIVDYLSGDVIGELIPKTSIEDFSEVFTWTANHSMDIFKLTAALSNNVILNAPSGQGVSIEVVGAQQYLFDVTQADFKTNSLINMGILSFDNLDTSIQQSSLDILYDVAGGGKHTFRIDNSPAYDFAPNGLDMNGNNLIMGLGIIEFDDTSTSIRQTGLDILYDVAGGSHSLRINNSIAYNFSVTQADFNTNNLLNLGTLNTHTIPTGTSTFAIVSDNLSVFAATTSLQLAGVISDETGSGLLVFGTSPTIITPTIASFTNSTHDHSNAAGGGTLLSTTALSDTANIVYNNQNNDLNAFYTDIDGIAVPANPAAAHRRLFVDSADGLLKVRTPAGTTVSLEAGGDAWSDPVDSNIAMSGFNITWAVSGITSAEVSDQLVHTIKDDTANAGFKIVNSDGNITLANATGTANEFLPRIRTLSAGSTFEAFSIFSEIQVVDDTGTAPIWKWEAQRVGNADIVTRPILQIFNNATKLWEMDKNGTVTMTTSNTTDAGLIIKDTTAGKIELININAGSSRFFPTLLGTIAGTTTTSMIIRAEINSSLDTGTSPLIVLGARQDDSTVIDNRDILEIQNLSTPLWVIDKDGNVDQQGNDLTLGAVGAQLIFTDGTFIDEASADSLRMVVGNNGVVRFEPTVIKVQAVADLVLLGGQLAVNQAAVTAGKQVAITIPDDTLNEGLIIQNTDGFIAFVNGVGSAGRFIPKIQLKSANAADPAIIEPRIPVASDSGTVPTIVINAKQDDDTPVVTRPIMAIRNNGVDLWQIDVAGNVDMQGNDLTLGAIGAELIFSGDTLIKEGSSNRLDFLTAGGVDLAINASSIAIPSTNKLFLDGVLATGDTFIAEGTANVMGFTTNGNQNLTVRDNGVVIGNGSTGTTRTDQFLYIPTSAGTPTGVPAGSTGRVALTFDTSANKIWVYNGAWRGVLVT